MGSLMIVLHLLVPVVGASCLDDAIPPAQRKILMNPNGERYPVGFFQCNWAASAAANVLAATLVEEATIRAVERLRDIMESLDAAPPTISRIVDACKV